MPDIFQAGYGQMWLPPPERADTGNLSVGYDCSIASILGSPRNETLYGTENVAQDRDRRRPHGRHQVVHRFDLESRRLRQSHRCEFSWRRAAIPVLRSLCRAISMATSTIPRSTSTTINIKGRLSGSGRHRPGKELPVHSPTDRRRAIRTTFRPARRTTSPIRTTPGSIRIRRSAALTLTDPALGTTVTRYNFNTTTPLAGDPVMENCAGPVDAKRSVDDPDDRRRWLPRRRGEAHADLGAQLPGRGHISRQHPHESRRHDRAGVRVLRGFRRQQERTCSSTFATTCRIKLGISPSDTTVHGNRDALDFPLFFAMRDNLSGNGLANNWHDIRNASQDVQDDGLHNGSQGVSFVDSHDNIGGGFPYLRNVAYAYTLMMPGNAIVYMNAQQFGTNRDLPSHGPTAPATMRSAATTATRSRSSSTSAIRTAAATFRSAGSTMRSIPNGFSNIYVYERQNSAIVGLNSRLDAGYDERDGVQTGFAPGTVLVELTGNADDPIVDPTNSIPNAIRVNASGQINIRIPRNDTNGKGYVIYGVAGPQGSLSLTNVASVLAGATPTAATNGTARLANIDVITGNSFSVHLGTTPVTLPAPFGEAKSRARHRTPMATRRCSESMTVRSPIWSRASVTNPADVSYGFDQFTGRAYAGLHRQRLRRQHRHRHRRLPADRSIRRSSPRAGTTSPFARFVIAPAGRPSTPISSRRFTSIACRRRRKSSVSILMPAHPGNPNNRDLIARQRRRHRGQHAHLPRLTRGHDRCSDLSDDSAGPE